MGQQPLGLHTVLPSLSVPSPSVQEVLLQNDILRQALLQGNNVIGSLLPSTLLQSRPANLQLASPNVHMSLLNQSILPVAPPMLGGTAVVPQEAQQLDQIQRGMLLQNQLMLASSPNHLPPLQQSQSQLQGLLQLQKNSK